jgi:diguanylate cyclase (GGDEF)-like protein/PAS domain S-box-containing protein
MLRVPKAQILFWVALAGIAVAALSAIPLLSAAVLQGRELTLVEDIILDLLIGCVVFVGPAGVMFWQQLRRRDQYQQMIREEKRKLDTAIDHMTQGLVMFDGNQRLALRNHRYCELYGLSPDAIKPGLSFRDLLMQRKLSGSLFEDAEGVSNRLAEILAEGKMRTIVRPAKDGRLVRIVTKPLGGGGWVATHEDITERQQLLEIRERAEAVAQEKSAQLDAALNNMAHGLCLHDADGRIILCNRRYREFMGDEDEPMEGNALVDVLRRRIAAGQKLPDPEQYVASILTKVRAGEVGLAEMPGANSRVLRVVRHPIETGGWVATFEDITDQRRAEQERDRNRAFLDLIINNVPSAIFVKRASDRRYVLVNGAGERFWGMPRRDMIGKTAAAVFPPEEASRIAVRDDTLLRSFQPMFDEREIITASGEPRMILSRRIVFKDQRDQTQYILGVVDDVTERKLAEARIARLAHYDPLTGVPNRTLFREQLLRELSFARRGARLAVLCIDLDYFKNINDTLGHRAGDELLREVAQQIRGCLNETDLIARLGGDEFAVVRTNLQSPKEAEVLAQHLRDAVAGRAFYLNGHQTGSDLSIGIALAPEDGLEIDELLNHADLALYGAKAEGRGNYRYYEPEMNARMKRRRALEVDLRSALQKDEFVLYYQPILALESGTISGCEALLRWRHPVRGMVLPAEFVPVAEETGLINSIGEWVLKRACADATNWPSSMRVAVNVSPAQFRNSALPLVVVAALAESGLPAQRLELEITESVLMQNNESSFLMLHQLHELGVRIALDDFGTGYSSLSYLRSFPFDRIKVDRSFIADLLHGGEAAAIVHAILSLASSLKMQTTAEGVETATQRGLLQAAGCDEMQGYLFSQPLPAADIDELIRLSHGAAVDVSGSAALAR